MNGPQDLDITTSRPRFLWNPAAGLLKRRPRNVGMLKPIQVITVENDIRSEGPIIVPFEDVIMPSEAVMNFLG